MSLVFKDRVCETSTTTGTGTYTLAGAKAGYIAFSAACANADTVYYCATNGTSFEVGLGTWATGGTLARTTIIATSAGDTNPINWTAGTRDVFLTAPASVISNVVTTLGALSGRNRIINGDMSIDQRNGGSAQTFTAGADWAYCVDRWVAAAGGANVNGQRVAGAGAGKYNYRFTGAASVSGITFAQRIEDANIYDLAGTTVTLSAFLADSLLTTVSWSAAYANTANNFSGTTAIASGTFTVNSTLTRYSANISLPSGAQNGVVITFSVGAQTSGTFTIGDVQLEAGTIATPFERRLYGAELSLCQRYFQRHGQLTGCSASATAVNVWGQLSTPMRTDPEVGQTGVLSFQQDGILTRTQSTPSVGINYCSPFSIYLAGIGNFTGLASPRTGTLGAPKGNGNYLTFSAEL